MTAKLCANSGCFRAANVGRYCAECTKKGLHRRQKPERKFYDLRTWRGASGCRAALLSQNPVCQRIHDGQQCHRPATVLHHLVDPAFDETKFFNPQNLVCLCAEHHPGGTLGTPTWIEGKDFVPTRWDPPRVG